MSTSGRSASAPGHTTSPARHTTSAPGRTTPASGRTTTASSGRSTATARPSGRTTTVVATTTTTAIPSNRGGSGKGNAGGNGNGAGKKGARSAAVPTAGKADATPGGSVPQTPTSPPTPTTPVQKIARQVRPERSAVLHLNPLASAPAAAGPGSAPAAVTPLQSLGLDPFRLPYMLPRNWTNDAVTETKKLKVPLALLAAMAVFALVQTLIDRRDPKVSEAPERQGEDSVGFE